MRRLLVFVFTLSALLVSGAQSTQASNRHESFRWEVGAGSICILDPGIGCPDIAKASNGDMLTVAATGNLDAEDREVSGGGTFEHRNSSGTLLASGTLKAKRLLGFTFYGCGGFGLPPTSSFCGGRAEILVTLIGHPASHPSANIKATGILVVTCLFGNPPPDAMEGFTLDVKHLINFDTPIHGETLLTSKSDD